jgi:hypothetical protein
MLEHEEYLFEQISRENMNAPAVVTRFNVSDFSCQICEYGLGKPIEDDQWPEVLAGLIERHWLHVPPAQLVSAFNTSRPSLPERLSLDFLARMSVAIDTEEEQAGFDDFMALNGRLRELLQSVPEYIYNPDMKSENVVRTRDGDIIVMTWAKWSIEPLGVGNYKEISDSRWAQILGSVNSLRKDVSQPVTMDLLDLINEAWKLEKQINSGAHKAAMRISRKILESPCLSDRERGDSAALRQN